MIVAVGTASLHLPAVFSLKEKRSIVKSITERIKSRYNVAVAEVGYHELHGRTMLGFAAVSTRADHAQQQIEAVFRFIEETRPDVVWLDSDIEIM